MQGRLGAMEGWLPIFFLAVILKIPILAGMYLVWYAIKAEPEADDARRRRRPQLPALAPHPAEAPRPATRRTARRRRAARPTARPAAAPELR